MKMEKGVRHQKNATHSKLDETIQGKGELTLQITLDGKDNEKTAVN
jgi:hypothetical protein